MRQIGVAFDPFLLDADALCRAVAALPLKLKGREREVRLLTLAPDILSWVTTSSPHEATRKVKANIRAHFSQFGKGERIDDRYFMKRVEDRRKDPVDFSHGVWSITPRFSDPQYRFFGVFAQFNWFVALAKQERWRLKSDLDWHREIDKAKRRSFLASSSF